MRVVSGRSIRFLKTASTRGRMSFHGARAGAQITACAGTPSSRGITARLAGEPYRGKVSTRNRRVPDFLGWRRWLVQFVFAGSGVWVEMLSAWIFMCGGTGVRIIKATIIYMLMVKIDEERK